MKKGQQSEWMQERIEEVEDSLRSTCLSLGEPLSYCELLLQSLARHRFGSKAEELRVKSYILMDEINLLRRRASFCQNMTALLAEREEILRCLRSELILKRRPRELNLRHCCEKLEGLRLYTLTILENLQNLAARMGVQNSEYATEIVQRLAPGTDFLRFTALRRHIEFANGDDPLFLVPLRKFQNLELASDYNKRSVISLFTVSEAYQIRLYRADRFLRGADNDQPREPRSMELKPKRASEFDREDAGQQPHPLQAPPSSKFMLPEIPTKKNAMRLKALPGQEGISSMIRRLVNDSQMLQRSNQKQARHGLYGRRRAVTQTDEYEDGTKLIGRGLFGANYDSPKPHRRQCQDEGQGDDELTPFPRMNTLNSRETIEKQRDVHRSSDSRMGRLPQFKPRARTTKIKVPENLAAHENPPSKISNKKSKSKSPQKDAEGQKKMENKLEEKSYQSMNRIKNKRRKKSTIRIIIEDLKQSVIESESSCKEEVANQSSSDVKWFSNYRKNRNLQFSPEVREKIKKIQKMSNIQQANQEKPRESIQADNMMGAPREEESTRYKNPIYQISSIKKQVSLSATKAARSGRTKVNPNQNNKQEINGSSQQSQEDLKKVNKSSIHKKEMQNSGESDVKKTESISSYKKTANSSQILKELQKQPQVVSESALPANNQMVLLQSKDNIFVFPAQNQSSSLSRNLVMLKPETKPPAIHQVSFEPLTKLAAEQQKGNQLAPNDRMKQYLNSNNALYDSQFEAKRNYGEAIINKSPESSLRRQAQSNLRRERTQIIQKCVFVSKSMEQSALLSQIKQFSKDSSKHIEAYLTTNYFKNRHIMMTTCSFKDEMAGYCLYYPYITKHSRFVFILHLEVSEKYSAIEAQLASTFLKYIFSNDPTNKIIFLRHKQLFHEQFTNLLLRQANYGGEIKSPIKGGQLHEKSFLFERKQLKCTKELEFIDVMTCYFLYITLATDLALSNPKFKKTYFSSNFLKKLQNCLKKQQTKKFLNYSQLSAYLQQQKLPQFTRCKHNSQMVLYSEFFEDCLINIRYFVYSKYFYFTIQPPYSYLYEHQDVYYILLSTSVERRYFILADKIYEETEHVDLYQSFRTHVLNKKMSDIFGDDTKRGTMVACPLFKKTVQIEFSSNGTGIMNFSLNWKEYIKGVRYFPDEQIRIQLVGPFFCGLVQLDEANAIAQVFSAIIQEADLIK